MAALLKQRAATVNPARLLFPINDRRAKLFEEQLQAPMRPGQRLPLEFAYARELLQAGQNQAALRAFDVLEQDIKAVSPELWEAQGSAIVIQRATTCSGSRRSRTATRGTRRTRACSPSAVRAST
jgi:hypothetical protein